MQQVKKAQSNYQVEDLKDVIVEAIQDKKGTNLIVLDLRKVSDAVTDFFIICEGDVSIQIKAIADNVLEAVKKNTGELVWHKEGLENLEWVLLDYVDIVVHVFNKNTRSFYRLEELWSDAKITEYE